MSEIKITRKKATGIILLLVVSLAITDWLEWREPEWESSYDSSLLSKGEVLNIAEQLIVYQIKQDMESARDTSIGYHLSLFNGDFESDFFDRFDDRGLPAVVRRSRGRGTTRRAALHIMQFEVSDRHRLIVTFSKTYPYSKYLYPSESTYTGKRMFKAVFEKRNGQWRYSHS